VIRDESDLYWGAGDENILFYPFIPPWQQMKPPRGSIGCKRPRLDSFRRGGSAHWGPASEQGPGNMKELKLPEIEGMKGIWGYGGPGLTAQVRNLLGNPGIRPPGLWYSGKHRMIKLSA
jgi:hypothetical protein